MSGPSPATRSRPDPPADFSVISGLASRQSGQTGRAGIRRLGRHHEEPATASVQRAGPLMEVVPQELCRLADECLKASVEVSEGWSGKQTALVLDSRAAGNSDGGFDFIAAHGD